MLAKLSAQLPEGGGWIFEPKWDGFRALVFKRGDDVYIQSRDEKPLGRYFPELEASLKRALPDRCVLDGEVVIATGDRLDFEALLLRIHPAASRVKMLAEQSRSRPPRGSPGCDRGVGERAKGPHTMQQTRTLDLVRDAGCVLVTLRRHQVRLEHRLERATRIEQRDRVPNALSVAAGLEIRRVTSGASMRAHRELEVAIRVVQRGYQRIVTREDVREHGTRSSRRACCRRRVSPLGPRGADDRHGRSHGNERKREAAEHRFPHEERRSKSRAEICTR